MTRGPALAALLLLAGAVASAEVPYEELITHDHHLVDADFIGVVHVSARGNGVLSYIPIDEAVASRLVHGDATGWLTS